jgi:membrane fusion protein, copper/silver efflux system
MRGADVEQQANSQNETLSDEKALPVGLTDEHLPDGESVALSRGRNSMKTVLSAVVITLLMILSYAVGWRHSARPATASPSAGRVLYWVDPMHPDYKSDHPGIAPDCGMQLEPVYTEAAESTAASPLRPRAIGIDSEKQRLYGIRVAAVEKTAGEENLRLLGRVLPEDTRVYHVDAGSEGYILETNNDSVGELVKKDQKLATCYGPDYLPVASGFLAATLGVPGPRNDAYHTEPRAGAVYAQGYSSLQGYTDRLRNLGMSDEQLKEIAKSHKLPQDIDIVSPVDGFILARNITPGQHFGRGLEFYRIADLSHVWILADIFGSEAQNIRPGAVARVTLSDQRQTFVAHVSNVLPQVDAETRTLKLRLEADNPGFALRPDMFVDVELPVTMPAGLTVPVDALIDSGREQRVFVERSTGVFEPRQVQTGLRFGDRVEIVHGLAEGERVVMEGTFLVDSESRLKSTAHAPAQEPH